MPLSRKRPEDKTERWQPRKSVRLYLDDIDELVAVMGRAIGTKVVADTDDFSGPVSDAAELKAAGTHELSSLTLSASAFGGIDEPEEQRAIGVRLARPVNAVITPRDDLQLLGAHQAIRDLLTRRQTRFGGVGFGGDMDSAPFYLQFPAVVGALLGLSGLLFTLEVPRAVSIGGVALLVSVPAGYVVLRALTGPNRAPIARVILAYRSEAPTWWERNRTAVVVGLATNAVVGLGFFLLGLWLGDD